MLSGIKSIGFDIGGVLVDLDRDRCVESFRALGFAEADKMVSCYHPAEFFGELERGEITPAEFCDRVRGVSGIVSSDDEICRAYCSMLIGIPVEKLRLMETLRERGYKIYAMSNVSAVMIGMIYEFFKQDGRDASFYFDKMFLSYEMGVMKPAERYYDIVLSEIEGDAKTMLFIDDSKANVDVARSLGMNVYLASSREDFSHIFAK